MQDEKKEEEKRKYKESIIVDRNDNKPVQVGDIQCEKKVDRSDYVIKNLTTGMRDDFVTKKKKEQS